MMLKIKNNAITDGLQDRSRRRRESLAETKRAEVRQPPRNDLLPDLKAELRPIEQLQLPERDVRKHSPAQVERLKSSIAEFGVVGHVLVRASGEIVDGGSLYMAAKALNLEALPCLVIDHLSDTQLRKLRLSLNRLQERGEWHLPALKLEFQDLRILHEDFCVTGFEDVEIDTLILDDEPDGQGDELPGDGDAPIVTQLGDVWRLGAHMLVCGDARDPKIYEELLGEGVAQLVLSDPPYNVPIKGHVSSGDHAEFAMASGEMTDQAFEDLLTDAFKPCEAHLAPGGLIMAFIDWRGQQILTRAVTSLGLKLLNLIVWHKTNAGMGSLWRSQHELLPVFKKPGAAHVNNVKLGRDGRYRTNVWTYPGASSLGSEARDGLEGHPTPKPVALLEDALLDITNVGDLVLDPFVGSGSTLVACETTQRRCRAIELEPRFVDLTVRRWQALTGKVAMHVETGESFDEREAQAEDADPDDSTTE